jgi:hypothetical protein
MLAYKFRGADQIPFALDIILNQRLYCSCPSKFNDPLEGFFTSMILESKNPQRTIEASHEVIRERSHLRVCSLSMIFDFIPLWAYYASDFSGLAIEVEISEEAPEVKKIRYTNYPSLGLLPQDDPKQAACESLCMKREEWSHEN